MLTKFSYSILAILFAVPRLALALEGPHPAYTPPPVVSSGGLAQIFFSLLLVLAAIVVVVWLLKRMNVVQHSVGNQLKVVGGVAIGQRERVVLLEVNDTWLLVGVGPGQIRTLHTMPKSSLSTLDKQAPIENNFNAWLKKFIEKRNAA